MQSFKGIDLDLPRIRICYFWIWILYLSPVLWIRTVYSIYGSGVNNIRIRLDPDPDPTAGFYKT